MFTKSMNFLAADFITSSEDAYYKTKSTKRFLLRTSLFYIWKIQDEISIQERHPMRNNYMYNNTLHLEELQQCYYNFLQNWDCVNPFATTSDQERISPYNINTISSRQVMRIEKNINYGIICWSNTKFSELTS